MPPDPKKRRVLSDLADHQLVTQIVEPLFVQLGYRLRDDMETAELSAVFEGVDVFAEPEIVATCVRPHAITRAGMAEVLANAFIDDIRALLSLRVPIAGGGPPQPVRRVIAISAVSISASVRDQISAELRGQVSFFQQDDLIDLIDKHVPEFWRHLDAHTHSYLRHLAEELSADSFHPQSLEQTQNEAFLNGAIDDRYVDVIAYRHITRPKTRRGQVYIEQDVQELPIVKLRDQRERLIALMGDAGCGKSTAIRRMAYLMARQAIGAETVSAIPILVRAIDILARECQTLNDCARGLVVGMSDRQPFVDDDLHAGRVHFFVDGLDEVASDVDRGMLIRMIRAFNDAYPKCQVIMTTRNYSSIRELPDFHHFVAFHVAEISIAQAESLVKKLLKASAGGELDPMLRDVFNRLQEVHGVELSPLLVAVFVATSEAERVDVPANITEMFRKWTDLMLGRWDRSKGFNKQYQAQLKEYIVQSIAFTMHEREDRHIAESEFVDYVQSYLADRALTGDLQQVLVELLDRSGLFRRLAGRVEFRHHILQEYFAGRAIPNEEFVSKVIGHEWWRMPIVFYFGGRPDNADGLKNAFARLPSKSADDSFNAAITLGLALQASYLTILSDKEEIYRQVVRAMAVGQHAFTEKASEDRRFPSLAIAYYYLAGRDAAALGALRQFASKIAVPDAQKPLLDDSEDAVKFWVIVGLLETFQMECAAAMIKRFHPKDLKLLLGIDMSCALLYHLKLRNEHEKNQVNTIRQNLDSRIGGTRKQLYDEIQGILAKERNERYKTALATHARDIAKRSQVTPSIAESKPPQPDADESSSA